jgi:hypothetical protein
MPAQDGLPQQRLAFAWLSRLLQQTAAEAPGPTEANLCEQMQGAPAIPGDDAAEVMGRYMPEVLQVRCGAVHVQLVLVWASSQCVYAHAFAPWRHLPAAPAYPSIKNALKSMYCTAPLLLYRRWCVPLASGSPWPPCTGAW